MKELEYKTVRKRMKERQMNRDREKGEREIERKGKKEIEREKRVTRKS